MEAKIAPNENFTVKNANALPIEHVKFVFSQAEKRLEDSHKTFDSTTGKSVTLITLVVALLSTLTAYFFSNNDFNGTLDPKLITVLILAIHLIWILNYLVKNILPYDYQPSGSLPSLLLTNSPFVEKNPTTDELHLKEIYYSELVSYDKRITHNFKINTPRLERIEVSIKRLICVPVLGAVLYLIISFLIYLYFHSSFQYFQFL